MAKRKKKENAILGEYQIIKNLKGDSAYQYAEAVDSEGKVIFLQNLQVFDTLVEVETIRDYFDSLIAVNAKNLLKPDLILQFSPTSLTLVYSKLPSEGTLLKPISEDLDKTLEYLHQASECLQALHNRRIYHGLIRPDSYMLLNMKAHLSNFGYAPLMAMRKKEVIRESGDFLAPEVITSGAITQSSDIYSFAKTIGVWEPRIVPTEWYRKATHQDPSKRYNRIREAFNAFETEYKRLLIKSEPERNTQGDHETSKPNESSSNLLPKYNIDAVSVPSEAGVINGSGFFKKGDKVTVSAISNAEWEFVKWSGDIESNDPIIVMTADSNKQLFASFKPSPIISWDINVAVEPKDGGHVTGIGRYNQGQTVTLTAETFEGWSFSGWGGDVKGKENPIAMVADKNKTITAYFEKEVKHPKVETGTLTVKPEPHEAGKIMGSGTCLLGQSRTIMAMPSEGWEFSEWSGNVGGNDNPLRVIVDSDKLIIGKFIRLQKFKLRQISNPPESGVPIADRLCMANSQEKLLARSTDPKRWVFSHWSEDINGSKNPIKIVMNSNKSVVANFVAVESKDNEEHKTQTSPEQKKSADVLGKVFESVTNNEKKNYVLNDSPKTMIGEAFKQTLGTRTEWSTKKNEEKKKPPKLGGAFQD